MKDGDKILYVDNIGNVYTGIIDGIKLEVWPSFCRLDLDRRVAPTPVVQLKDVFAADDFDGVIKRLTGMIDDLKLSIIKVETMKDRAAEAGKAVE